MRLDATVMWSGETATAQAAGRHPEVSAVLLHEHVSRHFGGSEK